jgi:hypothetical protein
MPKNNSNVCAVCKSAYVVTSLARICEGKHEAGMEPSKT